MQEGSFYCYVPRGYQVPGWLPFGKSSEKAVLKQLGSLHDRSDGSLVTPLEETSPEQNWHSKRSLSTSDHDNENVILLPGAGVTAQYGWVEFAGELYRIQPAVHATKDAFIVLYGYVYNVEALQPSCWGSPEALQGAGECSPWEDPDMGGAGYCSTESCSIAAQILLQYVLRVTRSNGRLSDVLSELQGCYAFVVYDSEKRTVYASRDPSGEETLYYFVDGNGCAHFANAPFEVPDFPNTAKHWQPVAPGGSVRVKQSGKKHKIEVRGAGAAPGGTAPIDVSPKSVNPDRRARRLSLGGGRIQETSSNSEDDGRDEAELFNLE